MGIVEPNLGSRKPIHELTAADLLTFPIWTFATGEEDRAGRDETWVRPWGRDSVAFYEDTLLVAADFETPERRSLSGFMTVIWQDLTDGAIIGEFGCLSLPEDRLRLLSVLKLKEGEVFPLRYRLKARFEGEGGFREGLIA
jgi:hypothetical protein